MVYKIESPRFLPIFECWIWRRSFFGMWEGPPNLVLGKNPHLRTLSVRGRMLKRSSHSHRNEPKDFGDIIEAGHMFPFWESRAGERNAGLGHGQVYWFEYGMSMYMIERSKRSSQALWVPQIERKYRSIPHVRMLPANWLTQLPGFVGKFHHQLQGPCDRAIRAINLASRPSHLPAGPSNEALANENGRANNEARFVLWLEAWRRTEV